jgi:hypothetical protein
MLPALNLLQSVPCPGSGLGVCECAANQCCFAEQGPPRVLCCQGDLSEARELVPDRDFLCNALAISSDGSTLLAGGHDGTKSLLLRVALADPQTAVEVELPDQPKPSITHVTKAADDVFAVSTGW